MKLFALLAALAAMALAQECPPGETMCLQEFRGNTFNTCFNAATHHCLSSRILLPLDQDTRCGDGGINSDLYVCHEGGLICPVSTPDLCSYTCYNSNEFYCESGNLHRR
jgi:hypothetical protein